MTQVDATTESNPHADTVRRVLDEAAGMFRSYIGGPGFWRYAHETALIDGIKIVESEINTSGPTSILFGVDGERFVVSWTPPSR